MLLWQVLRSGFVPMFGLGPLFAANAGDQRCFTGFMLNGRAATEGRWVAPLQLYIDFQMATGLTGPVFDQ